MKFIRSIILLLILCIITQHGHAQNLVPNYSFEVSDSCPQAYTPVDIAPPWKQPTYGTTDYFNACGTFGSGVPFNSAGYQPAQDGFAYCGIAMYADSSGTNYREYIQVKLLDTLLADSCYKLTFYVALGENIDNYQVTHFSAYFSSVPISASNFLVLPYSPQITYVNAAGIGDTAGWEKIDGVFQANGMEEYLTIGNFNSDALTTRIIYNSSSPNPGWAYYYIDSVSLIRVTCPIDIGINENSKQYHLFSLSPNPNEGNMVLSYHLNPHDKATITIYDITGKQISNFELNVASNQTEISDDRLNNGIYFYQIRVNDRVVQADKIIIIK